MRLLLLITSLAMLLTACGGTTGDVQSAAGTTDGAVTMTFPASGTVIYAESLYLAGQVSGDSPQSFRLEVIGTDDSMIASTQVANASGDWQVELIHGYTGEPTEVTIQAVSLDGQNVLASSSVLLSSNDYRPEGAYGFILLPGEGDAVGGDSIPVEGSVSGVFENTFTLVLVDSAENILDEQIITVLNPYFIDEVPYQADLAPGSYTGAAVIRAQATNAEDGGLIELGSVSITIDSSAG
ncbi:MAG: hypothetical protein SF029_27055 [bacterium]|nr:hypothetical protein [bacterium]